MKKTLIGILFLISIFYCYGVDFECNVSEHSLIKYSKTPGEGVDNPYKDTKITASTDDIIYGEPDYLMVKSKNKYYIDVNSLSLQNNQNILNELFTNKRWVPEYCYKALYNSTYNYIFDYEGNIEKLYNSGEIDYEIGTDMESISSHNINNVINNMRWYNYIDIPFLEREGNITVKYNVYKNSLSFLYCYVTEITESSVTLYISTIYNPYKQNKVLNNLFEDEIITLEYKIDGDYLYLYRNKKLIYTFINASDPFIAEYKKFLNHKVISIDNIIWPHHENGSCDYDGSKKTVAVQSTNVIPNKTMTVSENLKLRSAEATTSEVLTVMQAGAKVKILELGKAENIDGINSNWVKVEVLSGAKDREGNTISRGTVGWCYGGYLAETTEANKFESTDTKEISDIKEELKTMILELPQPEIAFFNESDLIFVCESKFLLPNYNIILSLWLFEGDFFLIYVIFNNSKFDKLFGIPMITSLDEIEKNFQYSSMFKQIERFNIPKISAFIYDYNHDGIDDILYLGVSYMTGYIHFIISGLSINLEKIEMFNIGKFPNFQVYPEFINYKCRQGIKYFDGEQFVFYYYDRIKQEYVQDETAISEELEQIHGSPDFFAEAGIDYTKLERPLLPSDLEGFSKPALRIWRNAVYTRHGRTFKSEDLQALFNEYAWYKPDENYSDEKLSDIDKANIKLIQEFEQK